MIAKLFQNYLHLFLFNIKKYGLNEDIELLLSLPQVWSFKKILYIY